VDEQRRHQRVPVSFQVTCVEDDASSFEGLARDLSVGGLFVESERTLPFGASLLVVTKSLSARELRLPAIVRWAASGGFGVQFGLLGAYATHVIVDLVKKQTT
jgi:hypothetical protein